MSYGRRPEREYDPMMTLKHKDPDKVRYRVHWTHAETGEHQRGRLRETYEDAAEAARTIQDHPVVGSLIKNVTVRQVHKAEEPSEESSKTTSR